MMENLIFVHYFVETFHILLMWAGLVLSDNLDFEHTTPETRRGHPSSLNTATHWSGLVIRHAPLHHFWSHLVVSHMTPRHWSRVVCRCHSNRGWGVEATRNILTLINRLLNQPIYTTVLYNILQCILYYSTFGALCIRQKCFGVQSEILSRTRNHSAARDLCRRAKFNAATVTETL